jgi:hypothetical protein
MALEFETMTAAGKFGDTCETPIMDLRPLVPDEVLRGLPRFIGRWEDDETMRILLDDNWAIETASDDCDYSVASRETQECSVILPNQRLVAVGFDNILYTQFMKKFCDAKGLFSYPTLFRRDGTFDEGAPLADLFIEFVLAELRGPMMKHLRDIAWTGSQATRHSITGILTQLDNGQTPAGDRCELYEHVELDWNTLTGGSGRANPEATITAGNDSITIHGHAFTGMTGKNLAEFLVLWFERLKEYELAKWADEMMEWELWVGRGQAVCVANLAACMQPCDGCVNPLSDPQIRDRAADFRKNKVIWLYPHDNIEITIKTSPVLDGQMILVPKVIGGRPMIGWVFRSQQEALAIINGELPMYGARSGMVDANPLYPEDEVMDDPNIFVAEAFSVNIQKNGNCINVWLNTETAIVLMGLHVWMRFQNISCDESLIPATGPTELMGITSSACADPGGNNLTFTVAALEDTGAVAAGDTISVYFEDGFTQALGIVVSYTPATDALILNMGADLDCTYGGGATNAVIVKHADNTP